MKFEIGMEYNLNTWDNEIVKSKLIAKSFYDNKEILLFGLDEYVFCFKNEIIPDLPQFCYIPENMKWNSLYNLIQNFKRVVWLNKDELNEILVENM